MPEETTKVTSYGLRRFAKAIQSGTSVGLTHVAVGDSAEGPSDDGLVNEVARVEVSSVAINPAADNQITVEAVLPVDVGGFYIREVAVLDDTGAAVAVVKARGDYKADAEGALVSEYKMKIFIGLNDTDAVNFKIGGSHSPPLDMFKVLYLWGDSPGDREITKDLSELGGDWTIDNTVILDAAYNSDYGTPHSAWQGGLGASITYPCTLTVYLPTSGVAARVALMRAET